MRRCMYIAIVLCCVGCSTSGKVTIHRITAGMTIDEVRAVVGELEWVKWTPETNHYRGWFKRKPHSGIFGGYPVLLTFDNDAILVGYTEDLDYKPQRSRGRSGPPPRTRDR